MDYRHVSEEGYCYQCYGDSVQKMLLESEINAINHRKDIADGWFAALTARCPGFDALHLRGLTLNLDVLLTQCQLALVHCQAMHARHRAFVHRVSKEKTNKNLNAYFY